MDDIIPTAQSITTQNSQAVERIPQLHITTDIEESETVTSSLLPETSERTPSASPLLPTPPDVVSAPLVKADLRRDMVDDSLAFLSADQFDTRQSRVRKLTRRPILDQSESEARSSESSLDSRSPSPIRRRDIIIISENKTRKRKHEQQRVRKTEIPDLLFSSADGGASADTDGPRPISPLDFPKPSKKSRARKVRTEV